MVGGDCDRQARGKEGMKHYYGVTCSLKCLAIKTCVHLYAV